MKSFCENDLIVTYNEDFYQQENANVIFEQLRKLDFKEMQLKFGSKVYTPFRKVCAFSDDGLHYKFSGTILTGEKWTPLILQLKEDVEAQVGCRFNYVLLNLYENGYAKIGAHMDNEKDLDPKVPIATLSFGAKRHLTFQREGFESVTLPIEHGSLYVMNQPTNRMWKHNIPAEPNVKDPRISLTFRYIKPVSTNKRKLEDTEWDLPENDWLNQDIQRNDTLHDVFAVQPTCFELSSDVMCCVKTFNGDLRVDIRKYRIEKERRIPTNEGVVMSPETWYEFHKKLFDVSFLYKDTSFISNNALIALITPEGLRLQQLLENGNCLSLKPQFVTIQHFQLIKLKEYASDIAENLKTKMYRDCLQHIILSRPHSTTSSNEMDRETFINILETYLERIFRTHYKCMGCIFDSGSQLNHDCLTVPSSEKYNTLGSDILLLVDLKSFAEDLSKKGQCNQTFLNGLDIDNISRLLFSM